MVSKVSDMSVTLEQLVDHLLVFRVGDLRLDEVELFADVLGNISS